MIEWKKMSEEQPTKEGEYLVCLAVGVISKDYLGEGGNWFWNWRNCTITHWAEINKPEE